MTNLSTTDPWETNWENKLTDSSPKTITCSFCTFSGNSIHSSFCEICEKSLSTKKVRAIKTNSDRKLSFSQLNNNLSQAHKILPPAKNENPFKANKNLLSKLSLYFLTKNKKDRLLRFRHHIKKPVNLYSLLFLLFFGMSWIAGQLMIPKPKQIIASNPSKTQINQTASSIPKGLFSYGGAPFYAPLVSSGINTKMGTLYPDFDWRYTKPTNDDFTYANGIKMLIDGELTIAFSGRPLEDRELQRALLRGIQLKQVPIAIDGIVFFANKDLSVSPGLNVSQIRDIYQGKISNWQQIDPQAQKVPIVPILLNHEDLTVLGLKPQQIAPNAEYAANSTLLLRKMISVPGAISFSSASLVRNQQFIKTFNIAETSLSKYIEPNFGTFKESYPLTRRIFIGYRQDKTYEQKAGEAYVEFLDSPQGQQIIKESGLVPLR
jgi:phosphate transport system substrate-binding protein